VRHGYHLLGLGGSAVTRARFRVRYLGAPFRLEPRTLLLLTHRSDWDIPLTTNVYWPGRMWSYDPRLLFVARDDMFLPGFLGGYPPGLPLPLRRALAGLDVGRGLAWARLALPVASATRARVADVRLDDPSLPLAAIPAAPFLERARRLRRPAPRTLGALDGGYVDLLWQAFDRAELPGLEAFWARRQLRAARDFAALVEWVRGGGSLALYPEGRPSPDGAIGPLQRGLQALIRRARPDALVAGGLAYDPLGPGRTRAYLALGAPLDPAADVLAALRATLPQTAGQLAAHALLHGVAPEPDARPAERRLAELLPQALAAARTAPPALLERLDRELRSARGDAGAEMPVAAARGRRA
jgi:hypothetical protein